jgi:membrane protease YdiL (CAAX protease family)
MLTLIVLRHMGSPGGTAAKLGLSELGIWAGLLFPVLYVSRRRGTGSLAKDFGLRFRWIDVGIGILGACAARSAAFLFAIPLAPVSRLLARQPQVGISPSEITGATWAVFGVLACIGAPIFEELLFRGLIQTRLVGKWGPVWGIAATSTLFGAAHLIGWQSPASLIAAAIIGASGAVLGFLRYRTGRLGTSIVAHATFNFMALLILIALYG